MQESSINDMDQRLQLAMKRFSNLIGSLPIGIAVASSDGSIEAVNKPVTEMFGYERHEFLGKSVEMVLQNPPWASLGFKEWHQNHLTGLIELEGLNRHGEVIPVDFGVRQLDSDTNERLILVFQDVTDRHLANQLKQNFYQMINHDVRSPLTNVVLFLNFMESRSECGTLTQFGRERLSAAQVNIERILNLADQLLELDKIESSIGKLNREHVNLREIIAVAVKAVTEAATQKDIELVVKSEDIYITADFRRLEQVFVNLITNGLGYSAPGKPMEVFTEKREHVVWVGIRDHGPGVPDAEKVLIFDRFKQGSRTRAGGFGIGLSICKEVVRQHGGTIGCQDAEGGGSIFWFELPVG